MLAPYPQLLRAGYRRHAGYRQAALAGLTANTVFGLLRAAVLTAVLAQRGTVAGYDAAAAVTYVWLGQGLITVVDLWVDRELSSRIRTGDVVVDLGRPLPHDLDVRLATDGDVTLTVPAEVGVRVVAGDASVRTEALHRSGSAYVNDRYGAVPVTMTVTVERASEVRVVEAAPLATAPSAAAPSLP